MKTILITDNLFVLPEHEKILRNAGFGIYRLDKPRSTEAELIAAIKGKSGYILGGLEHVTDPVIEAADQLEAIVVTAIGYKTFLPAWKLATEKGIAIGYTPDAPTHQVAEWAITAALTMNRHFLEVGRVGKEEFMVTPGLAGQNIGIIGLGRTGRHLAEMLQVFQPAQIRYYSPHRKPEAESQLNLKYCELADVTAESDVIFLCITGDPSAHNSFGAPQINSMKQGALLVSYMHPGVVDEDALLKALQDKRIRAISDYPMSDAAAFDQLPLSHWYGMNGSNTITEAGVKKYSEMSVSTMINLLKTGKDKNRVN